MKPNILIVDDEDGIRSLLSLSFSTAGYSVRTAENGLEAMQILGSEPFDAVLSDVAMPASNGHDLARWLARFHPAIHCILMTGWDTGCEDCPIAGRCSILEKPFSPNDAVAVVNAIIASSRGNRRGELARGVTVAGL
jgi:DNA-binding NtrC family response regulator